MITLIAAIGKNNEIGFGNRLLWDIPEDMKHFKNYTMGKVVIMGRKTYQSIGKPLPGRKNIVITTKSLQNFAITAKTVEEALSIDYCYPELVVIGGESVYKQTINLADKLIITHVDAAFQADAFFPEINLQYWKINNIMNSQDQNYKYRFVEYIKNENL